MLTFGRMAAFFTSGQLSVPLVRHALAATGLLRICDVCFFGMELLCQLGATSRQRYRVAPGRIARWRNPFLCSTERCSDFFPVVLIVLLGCCKNTPISQPETASQILKEILWDPLRVSLFQVSFLILSGRHLWNRIMYSLYLPRDLWSSDPVLLYTQASPQGWLSDQVWSCPCLYSPSMVSLALWWMCRLALVCSESCLLLEPHFWTWTAWSIQSMPGSALLHLLKIILELFYFLFHFQAFVYIYFFCQVHRFLNSHIPPTPRYTQSIYSATIYLTFRSQFTLSNISVIFWEQHIISCVW